jgi:hypothetical protein
MCAICYELVIHDQMSNHVGRSIMLIQVQNTFHVYKDEIL